MRIAAFPDPAEVPALFDGLDTPAERIGRLVLANRPQGGLQAELRLPTKR